MLILVSDFITYSINLNLYLEIKTTEVNELLAETAAYMNQLHPDCGRLAARICVTQLQKQTSAKFSECVETLFRYVDNGANASLISQDVYDVVQEHKELLDNAIVDKRDWDYDFFGYKTLERAYLLKVHGKVVERPQYMMMRVAIGIHKTDIASAIETYNMMS
jgi:ribonucleoside-diphosphate reductase alpha chain